MRARVVALLLGLAVLVPGPALAHESDPQVATVLESVQPALPAGVVVQVVAGVAAQLVADNPTPTVLEVLGEGGRPFLRLSSAGVEGDRGSPDLRTTGNPVGGGGGAPGPVRWTRLSAGSSWGWFDHRLHPAGLRAPADRDRPAELGRWTVPLRYGGRPVALAGAVRFAPLRGTVQVSADPAPAGLQVQVLQGRLPGLLLAAGPSREVAVLGPDGRAFLELGRRDRLDVRSRTHVEDRQARGEAAGPAGPVPSWQPLGAPSHSWLDTRLAAPGAVPDDVVRAGRPAVLRRWQVPVVVDGRRTALTGEVRWVPSEDLARAVTTSSVDEGGRSLVPVGGGLAALGVLVSAVALRRRARP